MVTLTVTGGLALSVLVRTVAFSVSIVAAVCCSALACSSVRGLRSFAGAWSKPQDELRH